MKFVSKMANHRIILRPGLQGNPILGSEPVPTLYVQFRDGMVSVDDEDLLAKMLKHKGLGKDFIKVEENESDPYAYNRKSSEPVHVMSEIDRGQPINRSAPPVAPGMSPNVSKMIEDRAKEIAMTILAEMTAEAKTDTAPVAEEVENEEEVETPTEEEETKETASTPKKTTKKKAK